ncbi:MAG TPA: hypothetical protein DD490_22855, partial [Acidobacteria bacterium]|nr:hypothetical protein [Acidobacteriota bacterium]
MTDRLRSLFLCTLVSLLPPFAAAQTATLVRDINQEGSTSGGFFADSYGLASVPGHVFFPATTTRGDDYEMWTSDGTAEGTFQLKDVCPGPCGSETRVLGSLKGVLFWAGLSGDRRYYLWRSDGT